ncbi:uncharacterized protein LOC127836468 [Dreissena polymorpha]|uniref:Uncharacterized protein n=1 Tax=Dreissena polymorpha TaxID=45954 RepID=A0A9D4FUB1_DREPO|nr:uncharacterized protein LOC127836468 [Dreissena polymorpha]KAH3804421.1 hypothetical protein DPMN_132706 [Dreissena polymorpha]
MHSKGVTIYTSSSLLKEITEAQPEIPKVADYCLNKHTLGHPFVLIVDREMESILKKRIEYPLIYVNMMCVLLLGTLEDDTYIPPMRNIFIKYATVSNILTSTDDILERTAFSVLTGFVKRFMALYGNLDERTDVEKETMLFIYASARNTYARSKVPNCERPSIPETIYQYPANIDSVKADLLLITGVIGCSKSCGKIEVCIERKVFEDVTVKVQQIAYANNINVKCVSCTFTKYFSSGDKIDVNTKFGTLGGFAHRYPKPCQGQMTNEHSADGDLDGNQRRLAAVTAKHMTAACGHGRMDLVVDGQKIGHTDLRDLKHDFDVLPIDVYQKYEKNCDLRFKTEKGKHMYGVLINDELRQCLPKMPVFIWGAKSSPGLGRIENIMDMSDGIYITITDRKEGFSFSKPGDSGAIICGEDLRENTLYPIAVLSGELEGSSPPRYVAVLMKESFEQLGKIYASEYKLCIDES